MLHLVKGIIQVYILLCKRLIFQRRDNAIFFLHNGSQEMLVPCPASNARMEQCKHFTILWRRDNASKSCHR